MRRRIAHSRSIGRRSVWLMEASLVRLASIRGEAGHMSCDRKGAQRVHRYVPAQYWAHYWAISGFSPWDGIDNGADDAGADDNGSAAPPSLFEAVVSPGPE